MDTQEQALTEAIRQLTEAIEHLVAVLTPLARKAAEQGGEGLGPPPSSFS